VDGDRQAALAGLRYQYARNIASPRFADLADRLLATGPEARDLWKRHDLDIPRKLYHFRIQAAPGPAAEVSVVFTALSARLSLLVAMLPEGHADPA
jgi:hypothetical protein